VDNLTDIKDLWAETLKLLETEIGADALSLWIRPIKPIFIENDTFKIEVPDSMVYNTIKSRYEAKLVALLKTLTGRDLKINYSMSLAPSEPEPQSAPVPQAVSLPTNHSSFNPHYTFEGFIVGASNRFAYASAEGLVKNPGQTPFFIYSAPGLGKTHLMHAIAHGLFKSNPSARILYTASENFVNEYIDAVRGKADGAESFRNKYRKLDCLLLDDIQFLVDKERSEEEFFYTFNALFESKKQIVITSDRPPRELAMGDRLISRFLQGVVADIKLPDFETRVAILRQKRDQHAYEIPDDIITFIAENVKKNIRELEGCLITVGNFCANMRIQPSIDAVKEIIKDHISDPEQDERKIEIETIKGVVAEKYNIEMKDFSAKKKTEALAFPRQVAMYLACTMTDMTLKDIGEAFGRDHSTVNFAKNKISQMVQTDPYFNETLNQMLAKIKNVNKSV
jgi:chromosomal replication initiator protein